MSEEAKGNVNIDAEVAAPTEASSTQKLSGEEEPVSKPKNKDDVQEAKQNVEGEKTEGQQVNRRSSNKGAGTESKKDASLEEGKKSENTAVEPQQSTSSSAEPNSDVNTGKAKRKNSSEKKADQQGRRSSKEVAKRKSTRKPSKDGSGTLLDDDEDEEKEEEPKTIYPIDEKVQQTLRTAWTLLIKKNQKKKTEINEADVPTVMRSIGINPTEAQIQTLIAYAKTQDSPACSKNHLTYENFEQRVAETLHLQPELWVRKSRDQILAALHTICDYKDDIDGEKFKKLLMTKGDVMTDPEGSAMLRVARDRDTGMVYLDEYADILSKDAIPQPPPDPTVWL
ncbi:hypothetical protein R1sor_023514 [Riccia sorocarpa]|uniref:Uncharacterized protein n=1 Tax=Riccia sorocarpa TaxID=122646 RepID=A0ABD3GNM9_9MARC